MTMIPNNERATLNEGTTLMYPSLHGWGQISPDDDVRAQIQYLIRKLPYPWSSVEFISPLVEIKVMDVLQRELDDVSCLNGYRTACIKCLRALSKARNIVPSSFSSPDVTRERINPIGGGGFADIWKGSLHDTQVCLKVLRVFISGVAREKLLRDFCQEALVWRQLHHPNVLPFLGVSEDLFAPSYCLISPWMVNGNIISYLETHPDHDRLTSLVQIAEGMKYLHNHDPPIVHADIRGANVLVMDDLSCCLADFGLSLFAESQVLDSSSRMSKGSIRWLAPEYMDSTLFKQSYLTARDIYAYGCTVIEIFTGKPPFSDIKNEAGVIHEVLTKRNHPPRPPLDVFPDDALWALVKACLATASSVRPDAIQILSLLTCGVSRIFNGLDEPESTDSEADPFIIFTTPLYDCLATGFIDNDGDMFSTGGMGDLFKSPDSSLFASYEELLNRSERSPAASDTEGEATQSLSTQTTPSSSKRHRSSPLASRSASPTFPKTKTIHLKPSQTSEGTDIPRAKRTKVEQPADVHALPLGQNLGNLFDVNPSEQFTLLDSPDSPPNFEPFVLSSPSWPAYQEMHTDQNLVDELFLPWPDEAAIVPRAVQGDGNSDEGASPDSNVADGLRIITCQAIPPDIVHCKGSPSTPATSTTESEATPTRHSHSANQTTPSSGKRRRSSSPEEPSASPSTRSANPNPHTKSENIHLEPSQASEGMDVPHAKRMGKIVAGYVLPSEQDATSHEGVTSSLSVEI